MLSIQCIHDQKYKIQSYLPLYLYKIVIYLFTFIKYRVNYLFTFIKYRDIYLFTFTTYRFIYLLTFTKYRVIYLFTFTNHKVFKRSIHQMHQFFVIQPLSIYLQMQSLLLYTLIPVYIYNIVFNYKHIYTLWIISYSTIIDNLC